MASKLNRRRFLGSALASSAFTIVPRHVLGGRGYVPPNEKIRLAHIGMGTQGFKELGALLQHPQIEVVAVCDPNRKSEDYIEWGKHSIRRGIRSYLNDPQWGANYSGCPGGREVGREVVDAFYAKQGKSSNCTAYADFRELLEVEKDLDAVKIMTPDHLHGTIAIAAFKKGLHAMMHKPVSNRLAEGRRVLEVLKQNPVATHLLAYGVGTGNGRIVEQIKQGVIGELQEIHNWTNRPVWPQYTEISLDRPTIPKGFDWDLWLGPEKHRPYHPHYTHTVFRGWYDFGAGSLADMGIYSLWPVFVGLQLGVAKTAEAWATHTSYIDDYVSKRRHNDFAYPTATTQRFQFSDLELFWYDGGMRPRLPREIEKHESAISREGILFIGDQGMIMAGFMGQNPQLFKQGKKRALVLPESSSAPNPCWDAWVKACRGGDPSPGCFTQAASITDTVNMGTVALRAGKKVVFDSKAMKITNVPEANKYLHRGYRKGWEL